MFLYIIQVYFNAKIGKFTKKRVILREKQENIGEYIEVEKNLLEVFNGFNIHIGCIATGDKFIVNNEEKKNLKVSDLLAKFEEASGGEFANDRMMLS